MKKRIIKKEILLEYYEDNSKPSEQFYSGGPISPENFEGLIIQSFQNGGKTQVHIKGTVELLEDLGKYLINLASYQTIDPDYHDHFDESDCILGNTELIIHHPDSNWNI